MGRRGYSQNADVIVVMPLGAGGIMFFGLSIPPSVRPSVRPKPEIPSVDLNMGPLVHPTNGDRLTACPSVRLSVRPSREVSGHLPENAWREWPEILHADASWPSSELISLWPRSVDFSNFGTILTWWNGSNLGVSGHFPENAWKKWPEILHADVSWPPSELISLRPWSVDFCNFGTILTLWNRSNLGFPGISWIMHGVIGLKYGMLLYPDHLQNWLDYGHGLVIFLILVLFWLSETGQIWGFQAFWSCSVDFPHYGDPLAEVGHIWGFWALSGERVGVNVEGRAEA